VRRGLGSPLLVILTAGAAIGVAAWGFVLCPRSRASGPSARPLASSTLDPPPAQRGFRAPRSRGCPHHALTGSDAAARRFRASKKRNLRGPGAAAVGCPINAGLAGGLTHRDEPSNEIVGADLPETADSPAPNSSTQGRFFRPPLSSSVS
jgi:hypothetical protein